MTINNISFLGSYIHGTSPRKYKKKQNIKLVNNNQSAPKNKRQFKMYDLDKDEFSCNSTFDDGLTFIDLNDYDDKIEISHNRQKAKPCNKPSKETYKKSSKRTHKKSNRAKAAHLNAMLGALSLSTLISAGAILYSKNPTSDYKIDYPEYEPIIVEKIANESYANEDYIDELLEELESNEENIEIKERNFENFVEDFENNEAFQQGQLKNMGPYILQYSKEFNVDPYLSASIMGAETRMGQEIRYNNPAGMMDPETGYTTLIHFNSIESGVRCAIKNIAKNYIDQGKTTINSIGDKYCPLDDPNDVCGLNKNWKPNVLAIYQGLANVDIDFDTDLSMDADEYSVVYCD